MLVLTLLLAACTPDETGYGDTDRSVVDVTETDGPEVAETDTDVAPDDDTDGAGGGGGETDETDAVAGTDETDDTDDALTHTDDTDGPGETDDTDGPGETDDTDGPGESDSIDDTDTDLVDTWRQDDTACGATSEHQAPCDSGGACGEDKALLTSRLVCDGGAGSHPWHLFASQGACTDPRTGTIYDFVGFGGLWSGWAHYYDPITLERVAVEQYSDAEQYCGARRSSRWWGPVLERCRVSAFVPICEDSDTASGSDTDTDTDVSVP